MSDSKKGPDEVFCTSCGEVIKKEAEICPNCRVRNENYSNTSQTATDTYQQNEPHDPSQYETTVSGTWWYGIAGGILLWAVIFVFVGSLGDSLSSVAGVIILVAWIGLPISAYFDMEYVRANGDWNPNTPVWLLLFVVWLINIIAGVVYLYRRHEVLGEP